jgi:hypothetical protein
MTFDVLSFMGDYGIVLTALILALLVIVYIVWHYVRKRWIEAGVLLGKWDQILLLLEVEIENSSGNLDSIKHLINKFREEFKIYEINHSALTRKHQEESALTASEDHWKNCPIERCPTMQKITIAVEEYRQWLHDYTDETKITRELTRESINQLTNKLDKVTSELLGFLHDFATQKREGEYRRKQ